MSKRLTLILFGFIVILLSGCGNKQSQYKFKTRNEIPKKYKWNLTSLCKDSLSWISDCKKLEKDIRHLKKSETKITVSNLKSILYRKDSIYNEFVRLYLYALMQEDINQNDESAQNMRIQMDGIESQFNEASYWIEPALLCLDSTIVMRWFEKNVELRPYAYYYKNLLRMQKYVVDNEQQKIINNFFLPSSKIENVYDELFYSDLTEPEFNTQTNDRKQLKEGYINYTNFYASKRNTVAALLSANCQMKYEVSKSQGFSSVLEEDLLNDNVPIEVFKSLISQMGKSTAPLIKYYKLRAEALKIDDYQPYDDYRSLSSKKNHYDYEKAKVIIENALSVYGDEYHRYLMELLDSNKIDVYPINGKISSVAYTVYSYGKTPYIMTTFEGGMSDIFDLIHELGHAIHAIYSMKNQPLSTYEPSIFKDEITSTINELILIDYLLENSNNSSEKLQVLETAIDNMEYYYTQALESEFTYELFSAIEEDDAITASYLDSLYTRIYTSYYDDAIKNINPSNWTKFGMLDYYNYKYVSSMTVAIIFFNGIKTGDKDYLTKYIDFLKSGGDDYPLNQLKLSGIDITQKDIFTSIGEYTSRLVNIYEKVLKQNKYIN